MSLNIAQYSKLLTQYPINWEKWENDIQQYVSLLKEWNPVLNLVSLKDIETSCISHIEDSLSLIPYILDVILISKNKVWLDIGSGGGFPAIPVLLIKKDIPTLLIERKSKKAGFLQMLISKFKLINTKVVYDTFPQCLPRMDIRKEDIGVITSRGIEKPQDLALFLNRWMTEGMKYLCQSPTAIELFHDNSFKKEFVSDDFSKLNMRRGRLVILERKK